MPHQTTWTETQEFAVIVVGSGAGALLAAIRASDEGLKLSLIHI